MTIKPTWIKAVFNYFLQLDYIIITAVLSLYLVNIVVQYSANDQIMTRLYSDIFFLLISFFIMLLVASISYNRLHSLAIPLYVLSILLLIIVLYLGTKINGARRWLDLGIRIQPSEICKLAVPLMVASYLSLRDRQLAAIDYIAMFGVIILPCALIAKQPDLGTAILVFCSGFFVLFLSGLPWRVILVSLILMIGSTPLVWRLLHDYQKHRIMTLIDPKSDPLGAGYHILQGMIAIGSGGIHGKGYLKGSQIHLNFIPEKHTDFVISVLAEEFGYIGVVVILAIYLIIILRGLKIMRQSADLFGLILSGSISLSLMLYVVINVGMVGGIFPVVGVPLPLISYGGTATLILMVANGLLLAIDRHNRIKV